MINNFHQNQPRAPIYIRGITRVATIFSCGCQSGFFFFSPTLNYSIASINILKRERNFFSRNYVLLSRFMPQLHPKVVGAGKQKKQQQESKSRWYILIYTQHILYSKLRVRFPVGYIPIGIRKLDCYRYNRNIIFCLLWFAIRLRPLPKIL